MKTLIALLLSLPVYFSQAQTRTETRVLEAFDQITISNAIEAELVTGENHGIEITASGIDLDNIESKVDKRKLVVEISGANPKSSSVKVKITYANLNHVDANTSAKVFVREPLESKQIHLRAATNAYLEVEVKTMDLNLEAQTNAKIFIKGQADRLNYNAFTNAEVDGEDFTVKEAEIRTNTNAFGTFSVMESIKGTAGTRGRVKYNGDPKIIDVKVNTGGEIDEI